MTQNDRYRITLKLNNRSFIYTVEEKKLTPVLKEGNVTEVDTHWRLMTDKTFEQLSEAETWLREEIALRRRIANHIDAYALYDENGNPT